jgi:hypothetical protein
MWQCSNSSKTITVPATVRSLAHISFPRGSALEVLDFERVRSCPNTELAALVARIAARWADGALEAVLII